MANVSLYMKSHCQGIALVHNALVEFPSLDGLARYGITTPPPWHLAPYGLPDVRPVVAAIAAGPTAAGPLAAVFRKAVVEAAAAGTEQAALAASGATVTAKPLKRL